MFSRREVRKRVIIIISVLIAIVINAQETPDPASFFPTAVGNVWEYSSQSGSYKFEITRDSVDADYNHFIFYDSFYDGKQPLYKINPFYSVFAIYGSVHPALYQYYRLNADTFDTWRVENEAPRVFARVDKIFIASIFGMERYVKQIGYYRPPTPFTDSTITEETTYERYVWLASGIGEIYEFDYESGPVRILQGCIIDGITYGKVYVEQKETIPSEFILYQNYPNPFNPTTKDRKSTRLNSSHRT